MKWLLNSLKGPNSAHVSVNNVLADSKHSSNQHGTTITECFHEYGTNRLFVHTLTAEYKYSRRNMQNFSQQLQTQLSRKGKAFSDFLMHF